MDNRQAADLIADGMVRTYLQHNNPVRMQFEEVRALLRRSDWPEAAVAALPDEQFIKDMDRRIRTQHSQTIKLGVIKIEGEQEFIMFTVEDIEKSGGFMIPRKELEYSAAMLDYDPKAVAELLNQQVALRRRDRNEQS